MATTGVIWMMYGGGAAVQVRGWACMHIQYLALVLGTTLAGFVVSYCVVCGVVCPKPELQRMHEL